MGYEQSNYSLFTDDGQRKYLNQNERSRFLEVSANKEIEIRSFALTLFWSGARISEILDLKHTNFDFTEGLLNIESLKKRKKGIFRQVPLPPKILSSVQNLEESNKGSQRVWDFSRRTGYRYIKKIMNEAKVTGPMACPKGLRHSFAIHCILKQVPIVLIKKWLGHSSLNTTMIYMNLMSKEEKLFAEKLWR